MTESEEFSQAGPRGHWNEQTGHCCDSKYAKEPGEAATQDLHDYIFAVSLRWLAANSRLRFEALASMAALSTNDQTTTKGS
jgi:hypothetical protein